jgi:predicted nucleotidyltransferase
MPVRSLNSSILKWPDKKNVDRAVRSWSSNEARQRPDLLRIGYFGSYARGDWGVGSDLDLIAVVTDISIPFEERFVEWDLSDLPVPAEILVYSSTEWKALQKGTDKFSRMLRHEVVWTYAQDP